jgi:hypothetical protein
MPEGMEGDRRQLARLHEQRPSRERLFGGIDAAPWRRHRTISKIWVEKDALAGALWDFTSDYDVPLNLSRGMPSVTFLHSLAKEGRRQLRDELTAPAMTWKPEVK